MKSRFFNSAMRAATLVAFAAILACFALAGCGATASSGTDEAADSSASTVYTLFIGTNSQTDGTPVMAYEDAKNMVIDLALEYVGGYTIYDAQGGWTDDEGVPESEQSIVLVLDTDSETVHEVAAEIAKALDQSAILIEGDQVTTEYYSVEE